MTGKEWQFSRNYANDLYLIMQMDATITNEKVRIMTKKYVNDTLFNADS